MKMSRKVHRAVWIAGLLACGSATVRAQVDTGLYLAGSLGATLQNNHSITESTKGVPGSSDGSAKFGTGIAATATAGLAFNNSIRSDLEFGYRDKPGKADSIDEKAYSAMANLWIDILHQYGYFVYFGGGAGVADVDLHSGGDSDSATPLSWQIGGGAGVTLTRQLALSADFRRLAAFDKSTFHLEGGENLDTRFSTNAVTLSLRYSFGRMSSPLLGGSDE